MSAAANVSTDRTWPLPSRPWIMRMRWSELLFAHWPVEPANVAKWLPDGLSLDTREGMAWIGVVPFLMSNVAARACPRLPRLHRFPELNVRTYVTVDQKPGVWFFSLDAANRIAVRLARTSFHLPYMDAAMSIARDQSGTVEYRSRRTHRGEPAALFTASYRSHGAEFRTERGSLEHWLTARYCLYSADRQGRIYRGEIDHAPWTLSPAHCQIETNTMGSGLGLDLSEAPHLLCAAPVDVRAWRASVCGRSASGRSGTRG